MRRGRDESPFAGGLRGSAYVVMLGLLTLAVAFAITAALSWVLS
jgi:hypothetical protein